MEAIFVCERWGAPAKAQHIRTTYATVIAAAGRYEFGHTRDLARTEESTTQSMFSADLETVVQASQAIISEVLSTHSPFPIVYLSYPLTLIDDNFN